MKSIVNNLLRKSTRVMILDRKRFKKLKKPENQKSLNLKEKDLEKETRELLWAIQMLVLMSKRRKSRTSLLKSTTLFSKSLMLEVTTAKETLSRSKKLLKSSLPRLQRDINRSLRKRRLKLLEQLASKFTLNQLLLLLNKS